MGTGSDGTGCPGVPVSDGSPRDSMTSFRFPYPVANTSAFPLIITARGNDSCAQRDPSRRVGRFFWMSPIGDDGPEGLCKG
jgi:hypothetical protein